MTESSGKVNYGVQNRKDSKEGHGKMGTVRDSKAIIDRWKEKLFWPEVKKLQDTCLSTMQYFNYTVYANEDIYKIERKVRRRK